MRVTIVGAGIAGAATAIALRRKGFDVTLLEQASKLESVGAGLQIQPCATRVIHAFGLEQELATIGSVPEKIDFVQAESGKLVIRGAPANRGQPYPHYQVHRADFHTMLIEKALALGARLELNAGVVKLNVSSVCPSAVLRDGRQFEGDLVVGADGVKSTVRQSLFGDESPRFTGHIAYRAMVDSSKLRHPINAGVVLGPNAHIVVYPLRKGRCVNVVAQTEANDWDTESWTSEGDVAEVQNLFKGWHKDVDCVLEAMHETYKWGLFTREPLPSWSQGRVVVLGDASHAALPNLGAGAAMALEDGYLLAELLADRSNTVEHALQRLYKLRIQRCTRVQRASARNARMFHLPNSARRKLTYSLLGMVTAAMPQLVQMQLSWLQDYDITKLKC